MPITMPKLTFARVKRAFAFRSNATESTNAKETKTTEKQSVKERLNAASCCAKTSIRAASCKALTQGKALVTKLSCTRNPAVKNDNDVNATAAAGDNTTAAKPTKARRSNKAPLMIAARGEDEQLVVPDAQVVVPAYDGPTETPLPPPSALFANATTLDRLAREEAMRRAQEETA